MKKLIFVISIIVILFLTLQPIHATVITITAQKDNTLYENLIGSISNGAGDSFFVGQNSSGDFMRRGLLAFDIAGQIPPLSTINSVSLTLHLSRTISGAQSVTLHRVLSDWGEGTSVAGRGGGGGAPATTGDATWLHTFYDTDFWTTPGGDFNPIPSTSESVNDVGFYTWGSNDEMVADVQNWLDNPAANLGWILIGNETQARTSKRFDSRENNTVAFRPMLTINFTPIVECTEQINSDLNFDCKVDFKDFAILASDWLKDTLKTPPLGEIVINNVGEFTFSPTDIETVRPDIFKPGHFSIFDILVHLDSLASIDMEYHFDESMNTYVIDSINGLENWWYIAYYDGGWTEGNYFRMDHYPYKDNMHIEISQSGQSVLEERYTAFTNEVIRRADNGGEVIIPDVIITGPNNNLHFTDVQVTAHNLREDTFQQGVITAIDVILSLGDQGQVSYDLKWYDSIGTAEVVRNYWVERINDDQASGYCGFVYETHLSGLINHIHIPSDYRVINSPDVVRWYWIELGPCE